MMTQASSEPWWAALTVWAIVNLVNLLQSAGFISRIRTGSQRVNHLLGYVMIGLAIPAMIALVAFWRAEAEALQWIGLVVYIAFIILMVMVEYVRPVEFRAPRRNGILIPYLVLFFGSIVLMGLPMFWMDRRLWLVTVATSILLVGSMGAALRKGVG